MALSIKTLTPAQVVTLELGVRALAAQLGVAASTACNWKDTEGGLVPSKHHKKIIKLAQGRIKPDELIYGRKVSEQSKPAPVNRSAR